MSERDNKLLVKDMLAEYILIIELKTLKLNGDR